MRVIIQKDYDNMSQWVANYVVSKIKAANPTAEKPFVLGLPTGSTPIGVYKALVEHYKAGRVSFQNVVTFNMDEYLGMPKDHPQSYYHFMHEHLFNHIDIKKENINMLDGMTTDIEGECAAYEAKMKSLGGVDLFLGGVGNDGHLAFNEPSSSPYSRTRKVGLTESTIRANSRFFDNDMSKVPTESITVGVGTVMDSKEVLVMVSGENKAHALEQIIQGAVSSFWPVTAVQLHENCIVACDEAATGELKVRNYNYFKFVEKDNLDPATQLK